MSSIRSSRRLLTFGAMAVLVVATLAVGSPTATARADGDPTATITWSTTETTVKPGTPLTVRIDGNWHGLTDDDWDYYQSIYIRYFLDGKLQELPERGILDWDNPSLTLTIDTSRIGQSTHRITVDSGDRTARDQRTITVHGTRTDVTVAWPKQKQVARGQKVTVSGTVTGGARLIELQQQTISKKKGWDTLASTTAQTDGSWSMAVPTGWQTSHTLRITVQVTQTHNPAISTSTGRMTVALPYRPAGNALSYNLSGYRWNPCQTIITYRVRSKRLPKGALAEVRKGFDMVTAATGLTFKYVGPSKQVPWAGHLLSPARVKGADFLVGWATAREVRGLAGTVAGLGGASETEWDGDRKDLDRIIESQVVFDVASTARPGYGPGWTRGELILHELGHAVGLNHFFPDRRQIMSYGPPLNIDRFAAGDLAGLQYLGRSAGCFEPSSDRHAARTRVLHPDPIPMHYPRR